VTDYKALIDAETWAFIHATEAHYAPDASSLGVAEQRGQYDALCAAFDVARPEGVRVEDDAMAGVPIRRYQPREAHGTVLYAHGGGFVLGGLDSHDSICAELCARSGCSVVAVDYRLSPEHKHPAAYDDVLAVAQALAQTEGRLVFAGDSAGATVVASVAHAMRERVSGQVLIYPYLGGDRDAGSYLTHANAPLLTRADMEFFGGIRCDGPNPVSDPSFAPLQDDDFTGLPPTTAFTAECDPLCDDGQGYCERIVAAGGEAQWINEAGLVHGFLRARHTVPRARDSFTRIVDAVKKYAIASI